MTSRTNHAHTIEVQSCWNLLRSAAKACRTIDNALGVRFDDPFGRGRVLDFGGHPGAGNVSWGDWSHFVAYSAMVNSFLPSNWTDALAVAATAAEILLGIGLILEIYPRLVSLASAGLLSLFAFSMTL